VSAQGLSTFREDFLPGIVWHDDPIRIVVCDDHALFRRGLIVVLEEESDIEVLGEADSGPEAMTLAEELAPDVVLVDVGIGPYGGVAAASQISRVVPTTRMVLLTVDEENPGELLEAYGAGAVGLMLKETALDQAADVVRRAARREYLVSPTVAGAMGSLIDGFREAARDAAPPPEITERERLVVEVVARGADAADAAAGLGISEATAHNLLANLVCKLQRYWRVDDVLVSLSKPRRSERRADELADAARRLVGDESG
jgi:two-component system NarL family response regulator